MAKIITKKGIITLVIMNGLSFMGTFVSTSLTTALPSVLADMGINANIGQMLVTASFLMLGIMMLISPAAYARFGTRKIVIASLWLFLVGTLCATFAPNFTILMIGRILESICIGLYMPGIFLVFNSVVNIEHRGKVFAVVNAIVGASPIIAVLCSGYLTDNIGWQSVFMIVLPFIAVFLALAYKYLENYSDKQESLFDAASFFSVALGAGLLLYSLSILPDNGLTLPIAAMLLISAIALYYFITRQNKLAHPFIDLQTFRIKTFRKALTVALFISVLCNSCKVFVPIYLFDKLAISTTDTAMVLLPGTIAAAIIPSLFGKLIDKQYFKPIILIWALVIISSATLYIIIPEPSLPLICLLYGAYITGTGTISMTMTIVITNTLPQNKLTHGTCILSSLRNLASSVGTAMVIGVYALFFNSKHSSIADINIGSNAVFTVLACLAALMLFIAIDALRKNQFKRPQ